MPSILLNFTFTPRLALHLPSLLRDEISRPILPAEAPGRLLIPRPGGCYCSMGTTMETEVTSPLHCTVYRTGLARVQRYLAVRSPSWGTVVHPPWRGWITLDSGSPCDGCLGSSAFDRLNRDSARRKAREVGLLYRHIVGTGSRTFSDLPLPHTIPSSCRVSRTRQWRWAHTYRDLVYRCHGVRASSSHQVVFLYGN